MTGMEPWAISAVSGVAAMFFQIGSQVLGVLGKTLDEKTKKTSSSAGSHPKPEKQLRRRCCWF
ncbi:hypothetical protein [Nostoc sp. TCL240-02]|uniref:hypothetical protein n=1 Tax=Nostoc sp. TCL240-02 TaxID=2572090 RepID=UPI00157F90BD|nr:hypothetical protein [Nostoc sp. TCL240-02]QKQ74072.1 hypothetical protein FBB35_12720 [Nostoc sp. TCL240-02]